MFNKFSLVLPTLALALAPMTAFAGEVGVSNKYTNGWSNGHTYMKIDSVDIRHGKEGSLSYAHKKFDSSVKDYDGYSVKYDWHSPKVTIDGKLTETSEDVSAGSIQGSFGSYYVSNTASGYNNSYFGNTSYEHQTTSFSNF